MATAKKSPVKKAPKKVASVSKKSAVSKGSAKDKESVKMKSVEKKAVKKAVVRKAAPRAHVKKEKKDVIKVHQAHKKDTGSPKVQVALLTERIDQLTDHLNGHPKDNHSRRGLLMLVGKRRKILRYMESKDKDMYQKFIGKMGLRK